MKPNLVSPINGLILIDKPSGWSSFDVVNRLRNILEAEHRMTTGVKTRIKVGHSGTLDPFATGLLVVAIGACTKKLGALSQSHKSYTATLTLGASSTTGDLTGEIKPTTSVYQPTEKDVMATLKRFTGELTQTPPQHSAIKVGGVRAYKLAREGKTVAIKPRQVIIYSLKLINYDFPLVEFRCQVSSGTYIRTLAEDIALDLETKGYLTNLRRDSIGEYELSDALSLELATASKIAKNIIPCA